MDLSERGLFEKIQITDSNLWAERIDNAKELGVNKYLFLDFDGVIFKDGKIFGQGSYFPVNGESVDNHNHFYSVKLSDGRTVVQAYPHMVISDKFCDFMLEMGVCIAGVITRRIYDWKTSGVRNLLDIMTDFGMAKLPAISLIDDEISKSTGMLRIASDFQIENSDLILIDDSDKEKVLLERYAASSVLGNRINFIQSSNLQLTMNLIVRHLIMSPGHTS